MGLVACALLGSFSLPSGSVAVAQESTGGEVPSLFRGCISYRKGIYSCEKLRLYIAVSDEVGKADKELATVVAFWTQKSRDPVNTDEKIRIRLGGKSRAAVKVTQTFRSGDKDIQLLTAIPRRHGSRVMHCGVKGGHAAGVDHCMRVLQWLASNEPPHVPSE
jgi:hypothetical protein